MNKMDKNADVRLLTLYKQHYMDKYDYPLKCDYSCLGYYDGMSFTEVLDQQNQQNMMVEKRSRTPISTLWYDTGRHIMDLEGYYSAQFVGIFRSFESEKERKWCSSFWRNYNQMPYMGVGFLKLKDARQYYPFMAKYESENCLFYCTFDNADLVLLVVSDSLYKLHGIFKKIEDDSQVKYMHSIVGICEAYLADCDVTNSILEQWHGNNCHIYEEITEMIFHIATDGKAATLKKWFDLLGSYFSSNESGPVDYAYTVGHANISCSLKNICVRMVLRMLQPGAILTHQNGLYGSGIYNIETSYYMKHDLYNPKYLQLMGISKIKENEMNESVSDTLLDSSWCEKMIEKYEGLYRDKYSKEHNDGLLAVLQAFIRTLNALSQYERFQMSKEIFSLVFPALRIFEKQLWKILKRDEEEFLDNDTIKKILHEFPLILDSANSIMYHTIHTDQTYLMIPGYSGTSFSIPLKLIQFYLWFMNTVGSLLEGNMEFASKDMAYILSPLVEAHTRTNLIVLDEKVKGKLICVKMAQRQLHFPRNTMVILVHEIAHYIGRVYRSREERIVHLFRSIGYILAEGIVPTCYLPEAETENQKKWFEYVNGSMKKNLAIQISRLTEYYTKKEVEKKESEGKNFNEEGRNWLYRTHVIEPILVESCLKAISELGKGEKIRELLYELPTEIKSNISADDFDKIAHLQAGLNENRLRLSTSNAIEEIVKKILWLYREVFSDMAAVALLKLKNDDFKEAFLISEGFQIDFSYRIPEEQIRKKIVEIVLGNCSSSSERHGGNEDKADCLQKEGADRYLVDVWYRIQGVQKELINYAMETYNKLNDGFGRNPLAQKLENVFKMFKDEDASIKQHYDQILEEAFQYTQFTKELEKEADSE